MFASHYIIGLSPDDVVYCHLPLYHSSGGQVATSSSLFFGTKTIIRKKFSASAFWKDCVKYNVTVIMCLLVEFHNFFKCVYFNCIFRQLSTLARFADISLLQTKSPKSGNTMFA